jgi:AraC-like DNA-binding protein
VMSRFEEVLASNPGRSLYLAELCRAVGVSESTLRRICREHLGMGPNRFLLLRRLQLAHRELKRADRRTRTVTEVATGLGFWELGRFAVAYRAQFGETPHATLNRSPEEPKATQGPYSLELTEFA